MKTMTSYFKTTLLLAVVSVFMVACGNKDSKSRDGVATVPFQPGIVGTCGGCNFAAATLFMGSAYGSSSFPMAMSVEMMGDQNIIGQIYYSGWAPAKTYSGPAYLRQAAINVQSPITAGNCVIPPGQYVIRNSSPGTYNSGQFAVQQFELVNGPYVLIATMNGVIVDPNADGQADGFGAQLYVVQGPSYYGPQMTACMDSVGFTLAP